MSGESVDPFALVVAPIGLEPRRVSSCAYLARTDIYFVALGVW